MGPIGTLGNVPTMKVGSQTRGWYTFVDIASLIVIGISTGGNGFGTLRAPNGTSGYPVTTAKTLKIYAADASELVAVGKPVGIGYGDTDVGDNSLSAPTTPIYMYGISNTALFILTANAEKAAPTRFDVPASKYVFINATSVLFNAFGYEV